MNLQTVVEVIDGISESRDVTDSYEGVVMSAQGDFSDPTVPESCHKLLVFLSDRDILISDLAAVLWRYGRDIINNVGGDSGGGRHDGFIQANIIIYIIVIFLF